MVNEADVESHGSGDGAEIIFKGERSVDGIAKIAAMEEFRESIYDRLEQMVIRDFNRTCVIMWSMGNESGYSKIMQNAAEWMKERDPSRIVHYECVSLQLSGIEEVTDVFEIKSVMYPSLESMRGLIAKRPKRPYFMCEYAHAMGNSPGDLEDYWKIIYSNERFMGGCVWQWCDQGIETGRTDDGRIKYAYGGEFGELVHDGKSCINGVVSPERCLKPGALEMKNVYRPIRVIQDNYNPFRFVFLNTYQFLGTEGVIECIYEFSESGAVTEVGNLSMSIKAGSWQVIELPDRLAEDRSDVKVLFVFVKKYYLHKKDEAWDLRNPNLLGIDQFVYPK